MTLEGSIRHLRRDQQKALDQEREGLHIFFDSGKEHSIEDFSRLLDWLQKTPEHYLGEAREWIARFLMELYKAQSDKEQRMTFLESVDAWIQDESNF